MSKKFRNKLKNVTTKPVAGKAVIKDINNASSAALFDSWGNHLTNLGNPYVSRLDAVDYYRRGLVLSDEDLLDMYRYDSATKIGVDHIVDDSFKDRLLCDDLLLAELNRVKAIESVSDCAKWSRVFGNALILIFLDDGKNIDQKLDINNIRKVHKIEVYEPREFYVKKENISTDIEFYGEPEFYTIKEDGDEEFDVHRSRCILMYGVKASGYEKKGRKGRDFSVIANAYRSLKDYMAVKKSVAEMTLDLNQVVLKQKDLLTSSLSPGYQNKLHRAKRIQEGLGPSQLLLIDKENEEYTKHVGSISGATEVLQKMVESAAAAFSIPVWKFGGSAPSGLNASNQQDVDAMHDKINSYRESCLKPVLDSIVKIINAQKEWKEKPEKTDWKFRSLRNLSEKDLAEIRQIDAGNDNIYFNIGVIQNPAELAKLRSSESYVLPEVTPENPLDSIDYEAEEREINSTENKNKIKRLSKQEKIIESIEKELKESNE